MAAKEGKDFLELHEGDLVAVPSIGPCSTCPHSAHCGQEGGIARKQALHCTIRYKETKQDTTGNGTTTFHQA